MLCSVLAMGKTEVDKPVMCFLKIIIISWEKQTRRKPIARRGGHDKCNHRHETKVFWSQSGNGGGNTWSWSYRMVALYVSSPVEGAGTVWAKIRGVGWKTPRALEEWIVVQCRACGRRGIWCLPADCDSDKGWLFPDSGVSTSPWLLIAPRAHIMHSFSQRFLYFLSLPLFHPIMGLCKHLILDQPMWFFPYTCIAPRTP